MSDITEMNDDSFQDIGKEYADLLRDISKRAGCSFEMAAVIVAGLACDGWTWERTS